VAGRTRLRAALIVGALSVFVLGLLWVIVFLNLPTRERVRAGDPSEPPEPSIPSITEKPLEPVMGRPGPPPSSPRVKNAPRLPKPSKGREPFQPSLNSRTAQLPPRLPGSLFVEEAGYRHLPSNCVVELEQLCPGSEPGHARRKCFQENEDKLSAACRQQLNALAVRIKEDMQYFKNACDADVKQLCRGVQPGGGRILQCLEDHYQDVSDGCYQSLRIRPFRK
jgi:Cysteine rich repeat